MSRALGLCLILAVACAIAACAQSPTAASPTATAVSAAITTPAAAQTAAVTPVSTAGGATVSTPSPGSSTPSVTIPPEASEFVEEARAAVAQEVGVPAAQVTVVSVPMVEWPDMSLGCPEPGMAYAQIVTPGYLIRLSAGGKTFEYHADREGTVLTCANPQPPMRSEE